jgi:hypothetical protein
MLTRIPLLVALSVVGAVTAAGTALASSSGTDSQATSGHSPSDPDSGPEHVTPTVRVRLDGRTGL